VPGRSSRRRTSKRSQRRVIRARPKPNPTSAPGGDGAPRERCETRTPSALSSTHACTMSGPGRPSRGAAGPMMVVHASENASATLAWVAADAPCRRA
jgi:hypothetical protein